jgi:uncharacterized protein YjbI with pentapeptide repeats
MTFSEELKQIYRNVIKDLNLLYEIIKLYPLISLLFIISVFLLIAIPHWQVSGINNATEKVTQENQSRATLAQVLGGVAIGIGLYYTWRRITISEEDLKATKEGQITERFTRAVDQLGSIDHLGNPAVEIRLGGIYALESIANDSERYYSQIIEILTAYIRMNSYIREEDYKNLDFQELSNIAFFETRLKDSPEIQAIVTVISRRKNFLRAGEFNGLEFQKTYLRTANFTGTTTERIFTLKDNDKEVHLEGAFFYYADLIGANFERCYLEKANFSNAYLTRAYFMNANLKGANFRWSHLERASFEGAKLEGAWFDWTKLHGAIFAHADLKKSAL